MPHALAQQEGNKPDVPWPTLSKFLNIAGIFWSCFLLDTACTSKEFFIKRWNMFWRCSCGSFTKSKRKNNYWELIKIGCRTSQAMRQKCSDQNTKVVQFYPWTVTIPHFSGANDWIEIDNFCCLVSCSKRLYKWKSWSLGAGSNSSSIVVSIINAQWQLFDSDYRNCKPVEKTRRSMAY